MISAMDADFERKPLKSGTKRFAVRKHRVYDEDWNELAAVTRERILKLKPQPPGWCIYLNPAFTVQASEFSREFSDDARRCQRTWLRTIIKVLGGGTLGNTDYLERQLAHNGVLIIDGHMVTPHEWAARARAAQAPGCNNHRVYKRNKR